MTIIEVRGGIVQEVYTDALPQSVYIIDYDNAEVGADKLSNNQAGEQKRRTMTNQE